MRSINQYSTERMVVTPDIATRLLEHNHKQWVIDQVVRALLGERYEAWALEMRGAYDAEAEEYEYDEWDVGISP